MVRRTLSFAALALLTAACSDYNIHSSDKDEEDGVEAEDDLPGDTGSYEDVTPGETGIVQGRICDPSGEGWVVGADVWIALDYNGDGVEDDRTTAVTDADGNFTLSGVPLGTHTILVEKGSFTATFEVTVSTAGTVTLAEEECLDPTEVSIAVVTGQYDHIQSILDEMGLEYDTYNGLGSQYLTLLTDPDLMAEYDIIFFNCGMSDSWQTQKGAIASNVNSYVLEGGSIYSSDWAYYLFEASFPDAVDYYGDDTIPGSAYVGEMTELNAEVLDANIQSIVGGSTANLNYDLGSWVVPTSAKSTVDVLVRGDAPVYWGSDQANAPLAVRFEKGGTALYTTFHNESQITVDMLAILQEIILSL